MKERVDPDMPFTKIGDAINAYPALQANLRNAGIANLSVDTKLLSGNKIHEFVFEGAKVDLGDTDAEFALTLWYPYKEAGLSEPLIVEISFKYDTDDGHVNAAVARRALQLFQAMQEDLLPTKAAQKYAVQFAT